MSNKMMTMAEFVADLQAVVKRAESADDFELHPGPLLKGDYIVVEVNGELVPRYPLGTGPQWFVVLEDQTGRSEVALKPFHKPTAMHKARRYVAAGARL